MTYASVDATTWPDKETPDKYFLCIGTILLFSSHLMSGIIRSRILCVCLGGCVSGSGLAHRPMPRERCWRRAESLVDGGWWLYVDVDGNAF